MDHHPFSCLLQLMRWLYAGHCCFAKSLFFFLIHAVIRCPRRTKYAENWLWHDLSRNQHHSTVLNSTNPIQKAPFLFAFDFILLCWLHFSIWFQTKKDQKNLKKRKIALNGWMLDVPPQFNTTLEAFRVGLIIICGMLKGFFKAYLFIWPTLTQDWSHLTKLDFVKSWHWCKTQMRQNASSLKNCPLHSPVRGSSFKE